MSKIRDIDELRPVWLNDVLTCCMACGYHWARSYKVTEVHSLFPCPRCKEERGVIIDPEVFVVGETVEEE